MNKTLLGFLMCGAAAFARIVDTAMPITPVPEPSSVLLIGLGLTAIGYFGAKRAKNRKR